MPYWMITKPSGINMLHDWPGVTGPNCDGWAVNLQKETYLYQNLETAPRAFYIVSFDVSVGS